MQLIRAAPLALAMLLLGSAPCRADLLVGSQVTGFLSILDSGNLYNPAPATLNAETATFSFVIPMVNTVTAQFDLDPQGDTLTLTDRVKAGQSGYAWTQTFTDSVFARFNPVLVSNNLAGLQVSQTPNSMTFSWAGSGVATHSKTYSAVFELVDPPAVEEPSGLIPLVVGVGALSVLVLRKSAFGRRLTGNP